MAAVAMHRRSARGAQFIAALIIGLGHVIGWVRSRLTVLPGLAGAGLVSWGAAQVYMPAGWILGGLFLLAIDRQSGPHRPGGA